MTTNKQPEKKKREERKKGKRKKGKREKRKKGKKKEKKGRRGSRYELASPVPPPPNMWVVRACVRACVSSLFYFFSSIFFFVFPPCSSDRGVGRRAGGAKERNTENPETEQIRKINAVEVEKHAHTQNIQIVESEIVGLLV